MAELPRGEPVSPNMVFTASSTNNMQSFNTTSYEIHPTSADTIWALQIKDVIREVTGNILHGKLYCSSSVESWLNKISEECSQKVKKILSARRYKHVVQVQIGQHTGSGCKYISRCHWDAQCDYLISDIYTNDTMFCVVAIYVVYLY